MSELFDLAEEERWRDIIVEIWEYGRYGVPLRE